MARGLSILIAVAVALAVGVCPCALMASMNRALTTAASTALAPSAHRGCPACKGGSTPAGSDHGAPDSERCANTVGGDLPAAPSHGLAPAAPLHPLIVVIDLVRPITNRAAALHVGLPEPPTLLNLSCCLNT